MTVSKNTAVSAFIEAWGSCHQLHRVLFENRFVRKGGGEGNAVYKRLVAMIATDLFVRTDIDSKVLSTSMRHYVLDNSRRNKNFTALIQIL